MYKIKFWLKVIALLLLWGVLLPRLVHAQPGSLDQSFSGDGKVTASFTPNGHSNANSIAVQPDGKIVVAGGTWLPGANGSSKIALARFLPSGAFDPNFGLNGQLTLQFNGKNTYPGQVIVQPDGKILVAGGVSTASEWSFALFRFQPNGAPDPTFDGDGMKVMPVNTFAESLTCLTLQSDGKIVAGGYLRNPNTGYDQFAVLRFLANGQPDATFDGDGMAVTPIGDAYASVYTVLVQPDGKIVATGYAMQNGFRQFAAARYKPNGALDNTYSGDGIVTVSLSDKDNSAYAAALQADGKVVMAGTADLGGIGAAAVSNFAAVRLLANGDPDATFSGDGKVLIPVSGHADGCRAMVVQPDGKIVLGGYAHSNTNPVADAALVRLKPNGDLDPVFAGDGISDLPLQTDNSDEFHALALQADGKVVAAGYVLAGNFQAFAVARIITGATAGAASPAVFSGKTTLYPNPVREQATLEYELATAETVAVNLYDLQGRLVQPLRPPTGQGAGKHTEVLTFDQAIPPGAYLLVVESFTGRTVIKAVF